MHSGRWKPFSLFSKRIPGLFLPSNLKYLGAEAPRPQCNLLLPWVFMRIVCPSCASEYDVPATRVTPRKMVRCGRCGGEWTPVREAVDIARPSEPAGVSAQPQSEPAAPEPATEPQPAVPQPAVTEPATQMTAMDHLAASQPRPAYDAKLTAAWIATFAVLAGAIAAIVIWRVEVVQIWPPASRILGWNDPVVPEPVKTPEPAGPPDKTSH